MINNNDTEIKFLDIEKIDESRIIVLRKKCIVDQTDNITNFRVQTTVCLISEQDDKKYHKYCGFNKFTEKTVDLPTIEDGWKQKNNRWSKYIIKKSFNRNLSLFSLDEQIDFSVYDDWKCYDTLDNYGTGFFVFIDASEKNVHVYGRTRNVLPYSNCFDQREIFTNLIGKYTPITVFIGKSVLNSMTDFSGGYGDKYDGNSILLRVGDNTEFRYIFIGLNVVEFTTDEVITKYVSSVGNNQVPYPYAESENWCYCMSQIQKSHISNFPDREKTGCISYNDCEYINIDHVEISPRDTDNCATEHSDQSIGEYAKFNGPVEVKHVEKSCLLYD